MIDFSPKVLRPAHIVGLELSPGQAVRVTFADSDGAFEIHFDTVEHPKSVVVKEVDGLPGSIKGAALEIMYNENFDDGESNDDGESKAES